MTGWIVLAVVTGVFFSVLGAMWREVRRPLDETDQWCSEIDQDLDRLYGGWRN